jgi:transcriptional regulator GlxA family with amidase domain
MFSVLARGFSLSNLVYISLTLGHLLGTFFYGRVDSLSPDQHSVGVSGRHSQIVNQVILYMQDHITDNITFGELAQRADLSKSQLSLVFMEQTNYSPINFFINLKMQRACRYLELSNMTIQQVAVNMGYKDPYYFSRLFARTMGLSPSAYRVLKKG